MVNSSTYPNSFLLSRAASRPTSFSRSFLPAPSSIFARSAASPGRHCIRCFSFRARRTDKVVQDKDAAEKRAVVASGRSEQVEVNKEGRHSRTFVDVRSEEVAIWDQEGSGNRKIAIDYCRGDGGIVSQLQKCRKKRAGFGISRVAMGKRTELYHGYSLSVREVFESGIPRADEIVLSNMSVCLDRILLDVEDSFVFSPYHKAMREPFDYYMFGQNYIRPLVNFKNSYVGNITIFSEIEERIQQGHNVVLISNHQTEADPAIIALLIESLHPYIAENLTYIAGDRVVTDPLCKPFSMGRNLLCVYSKKHMNDVPELTEMKRRSNTRSLKEMALLLRGGSQLIWIAPSGGRDRPDPVTGEWHPAPFDSSAVDNMRRLVEHCGVPGHIYPLALHCYDIMPPPAQVEKEIGEKRVIAFSGTGLSAKPSLNLNEINATFENPDQAKEVYTNALYKSVSEQYEILKSAIRGTQGLEASTPAVSLSQPWD